MVALPQVPRPLHAYAVWLPPVHTLAAHEVPDAYTAQAPVPLQVPVVPQVEEVWVAHSFCGSVLALMGPQAPLAPAPLRVALQAMHGPAQAVSQQ